MIAGAATDSLARAIVGARDHRHPALLSDARESSDTNKLGSPTAGRRAASYHDLTFSHL